jgi:hypothetical protein
MRLNEMHTMQKLIEHYAVGGIRKRELIPKDHNVTDLANAGNILLLFLFIFFTVMSGGNL